MKNQNKTIEIELIMMIYIFFTIIENTASLKYFIIAVSENSILETVCFYLIEMCENSQNFH